MHVVFNDTAPTVIYTDCHTLSHTTPFRSFEQFELTRAAAAGISLVGKSQTTAQRGEQDGLTRCAGKFRCITARALTQNLDCMRSEEQTSELQSLLRNSYAVFC